MGRQNSVGDIAHLRSGPGELPSHLGISVEYLRHFFLYLLLLSCNWVSQVFHRRPECIHQPLHQIEMVALCFLLELCTISLLPQASATGHYYALGEHYNSVVPA